MSSFKPGFLESQPITHGLLATVGVLREFKGREQLYREQTPQALETLRQAAIIQSTESSNRIEGITAPLPRLKALIADRAAPRNRSEGEIAGYRDVLNSIHANHSAMEPTPGLVLRLHRDLYRYLASEGGRWKPVDNEISEILPNGTRLQRFRTVPAYLTPPAMETLHQQFSRLWQEEQIERLLLIPAYVLDFLCIHPFLDGNGRLARLLTLLLLYRAGFEVGRYISLERVIEGSKEAYYDPLRRSSEGWHQGEHSMLPWTEYLLGTLVAAYREFEERVGLLRGARGGKTELVLDVLGSLSGEFSVRQLQERCPQVSLDLIRQVLRRERQAGRLVCLGRGPEARWRRI
ncbi:MAG TPA: Fic family protein [Armatimonadota bacterium]|jgi:Fic family protein